MKRVIAAITTAVAIAGLAGCQRQQGGQSAANYEQQRKAAEARSGGPKGATQTAAKPTADEGNLGKTDRQFVYVAEGKRDPFRSFVLEHAKDRIHDRGPLEQFDLTQLSVVAVVWNTEKPRALILDPSGRGYVVSEGTMVGKNDGMVTSIGDNTVVIRETYVDYLGERTEKDIQMHVRQSQGG